jgi:UDP-glucose 4-epimerase
VLTLSAPFPFARADTPTESAAFLSFLLAQRPGLPDLYTKLGWVLPDDLGRVYDSSLAVELLEWRPHLTFDRLIAVLEGSEEDVVIDTDDIAVGRY